MRCIEEPVAGFPAPCPAVFESRQPLLVECNRPCRPLPCARNAVMHDRDADKQNDGKCEPADAELAAHQNRITESQDEQDDADPDIARDTLPAFLVGCTSLPIIQPPVVLAARIDGFSSRCHVAVSGARKSKHTSTSLIYMYVAKDNKEGEANEMALNLLCLRRGTKKGAAETPLLRWLRRFLWRLSHRLQGRRHVRAHLKGGAELPGRIDHFRRVENLAHHAPP